jgi:hypothetical protein
VRNGVEKQLKKVSAMPGHIFKISWLVLAVVISNLWITFVITVVSIFLSIKYIEKLEPFINFFKPTITDKEKKDLENSL